MFYWKKRYTQSSEEELVMLLSKSDEQSFELLFEKYHRKVYNLSRKMGLNQEDAEGIVQESFVTVWNQRESLDASLSFNSYLMTITSRLVIKQIRRNSQWNRFEEHLKHTQEKYQHNTEDYIIFTDLYNHAQEGIDQLPEGRKQIFMLSKQSGLTNEEISKKLNVSKRTVENQLYRATKTIQEYLKKDESK